MILGPRTKGGGTRSNTALGLVARRITTIINIAIPIGNNIASINIITVYIHIINIMNIIITIIRRATRPRAVLDIVPPPFVLGPKIISSL